jgi:xanthine dehydrogenase accessory factor
MEEALDLYEEIVRLRNDGAPAALCTVLLSKGSTPGKDAMKMLVRSDGSTLGSIGGGCVEADTIQIAQEVIRTGIAQTQAFRLNQKDLPESGLICGGQVTILVESVVPPVLVLFGGGHVGAASVRVAHECGFRVILCDDRKEFADSKNHPLADECISDPWEEIVHRLAPATNHFLVVMTRGHHDDARVLRSVWENDCKPRYLGMLGSLAKKAILHKILEDDGVPSSWLASVKTPIGIPIGGKSAGEIAVSLLAELVQLHRTGAISQG